MKPLLLLLTVICCSVAYAQPTVITRAIIQTTTNVIAPEEDDASNVQSGQTGGFNFRNFGDGETKSTTYYKDSMVKVVTKSDMGRTTMIRNNTAKLTTTLLEIMGNKTGFFATDEEQAAARQSMDSMMKARQSADTSRKASPAMPSAPAEPEIVHTGESKKIAGYNCKKVLIITSRFLGIKDTTIAWYTPEISMKNLSYTGGISGFGISTNTVNGLDKLDGFVMAYEMKMRRNRLLKVEVTKLDTGKEIENKEFNIPKDFDVKPMKDMQQMMRGERSDGGAPVRMMIRP